ncbi:MAG: sensor histidine kinase [Lapillicoccus sp.]
MPRIPRTLAARILIAVLGIVVVTMAVGVVLVTWDAEKRADAASLDEATSIAQTVADIPDVPADIATGDPLARLPALAERLRHNFGASYVVIIDARGKRYSHPNPALIGKVVEEPVIALDGQVHRGVDNGSLGRSANVKVPVLDAAGTPIGEVSVGILETQIGQHLSAQMAPVLLYMLFALGLGVVASLILTRAIKRVTFGLEPAEIVGLVQEREAMLHGIREGVVATDADNRINVLNEEARRLLGLLEVGLGDAVDDVIPAGQLREIVSGRVTGQDLVAVTDDHLLVLNRMPVRVGGREVGWVVTIRDRTELEGLLRQLDSVSGLTTALRAQEHEFANRLHVMSVLIEMGEFEEASRYSSKIQTETILAGEEIRARIASPVVTALLLAKMTVAAERDVTIHLDPASRLERVDLDHLPLVSVLGNLVDNAFDAVVDDPTTIGERPRGGVTVLISDAGDEVRITVIDTGPGIDPALLEEVFVDGFSTKGSQDGRRRGIGLALVHRLVTRAGGTITAHSPGGACFEVVLPLRLPAEIR